MQANAQTDTPTEINPLERRLDLAVVLADVDKEVDQRLKKLARTVKMAGFRPGKVPFKLVIQQYGPQVRHEAIGDAVEKSFGEALRAQNLRIAGQPRIEPRDPQDTSLLGFSAVFEVYPEVVLGDVSGREIERPQLEVGDTEVDKTLDVLRKQRVTYAVAERAAANEDKVTVDFTGRLDGEIFEGGQATDFPLILGAGRMLVDFEAPLVGAVVGETRNFDLTFPTEYHAAHLAGKTVQFEVTIKLVEGPQLPEVDGEFAKTLGIPDGDVVKMKTEIKTNLEREVKKRILAKVKEQALNALLETTPLAAPKALIRAESENMAEAAKQDLTQRGMDVSKVPVAPEWFVEQATRRVKLGLIVSDLVKAKELYAKPEQVRETVEEFAQSYEDPTDVLRWYYTQPERMAEVQALVVESNVVDWVLANAKVTDKAVSFDELMGTGA